MYNMLWHYLRKGTEIVLNVAEKKQKELAQCLQGGGAVCKPSYGGQYLRITP